MPFHKHFDGLTHLYTWYSTEGKTPYELKISGWHISPWPRPGPYTRPQLRRVTAEKFADVKFRLERRPFTRLGLVTDALPGYGPVGTIRRVNGYTVHMIFDCLEDLIHAKLLL